MKNSIWTVRFSPGLLAATLIGGNALSAQGQGFAGEGKYVSGFLGFGSLDDTAAGDTFSGTTGNVTFDDGTDFGIALGQDFGSWRLETEIARRSYDIERFTLTSGPPATADFNDQLEVTSLMLNVLADLELPARFTLYGGGGAGVAVANFGDDYLYNFAYQFTGGVSYAITDNLSASVGYRQLVSSDLEGVADSDLTLDRVEVSGVEVGLRWTF